MTRARVQIVVIGLGPAGAAAARLLAAWGHDVVAIDRGASDAGRLAESIPPSATKVLRATGAIEAVAAAGFMPWRGNTAWWADTPARVEQFPETAPGFQVLRQKFDQLLRELARQSGARIIDGRVTSVQLAPPGGADDNAGVAIERDGVREEIDSRIVIDASGRAGVVARNGYRVLDQSRRTIALAATWEREDRWPLEDDSHTLVASYAGGWAWSVPVDERRRQFTVMVDPSRTSLERDRPSRDIYLAEIDKIGPFRAILDGASLCEAPWGADASEYTASRHAASGLLLAGDAGSAINPLSSFGVKKALVSGWLAAIAAHTALEDPGMAAEAFGFFDRHERAVAAAAARQATAFAKEAAAGTGHPFWLARADADDAADDAEPDAAGLARDPAVLAAFAGLRSREEIHLITAPDVRIEPRPAVRGRRIVLEDHLISSSWPDGLRYLRGVDLLAILRLAPASRDVGQLFEAVRPHAPDVTLPDFLGALSVLIACGCLRHR